MSDHRPDVFTVDYTGGPGERTFFVQARGEGQAFTFAIEKQQVVALAEQLRELLLTIDANDKIAVSVPMRHPNLGLEPPIEPDWRVGTISLGYVEPAHEIVVGLEPIEEEAPPVPLQEERRFFMERENARVFAMHALAVAAEGRPLCQLCGLPMDPSGHNCPASNGHRLDQVE